MKGLSLVAIADGDLEKGDPAVLIRPPGNLTPDDFAVVMNLLGLPIDDLVKCGRCERELLIANAECCWYCTPGWLCYDCWDEFGHCGHKEADEFNEKVRKVEQPRC